jgi:hypothetical protein
MIALRQVLPATPFTKRGIDGNGKKAAKKRGQFIRPLDRF